MGSFRTWGGAPRRKRSRRRRPRSVAAQRPSRHDGVRRGDTIDPANPMLSTGTCRRDRTTAPGGESDWPLWCDGLGGVDSRRRQRPTGRCWKCASDSERRCSRRWNVGGSGALHPGVCDERDRLFKWLALCGIRALAFSRARTMRRIAKRPGSGHDLRQQPHPSTTQRLRATRPWASLVALMAGSLEQHRRRWRPDHLASRTGLLGGPS